MNDPSAETCGWQLEYLLECLLLDCSCPHIDSHTGSLTNHLDTQSILVTS